MATVLQTPAVDWKRLHDLRMSHSATPTKSAPCCTSCGSDFPCEVRMTLDDVACGQPAARPSPSGDASGITLPPIALETR